MASQRKNSANNGDFQYLLERARENQQQNRQIIFVLILAGLVSATASISLNLGVIEITKLKYGEIEGVVKNFFFLRLFLTVFSLATAIALFYYKKRDEMIAGMTDFLAEEKHYRRAQILSEFFAWSDRIGKTRWLGRVFVFQSIGLAVLLVIVPIGTFVLSLRH